MKAKKGIFISILLALMFVLTGIVVTACAPFHPNDVEPEETYEIEQIILEVTEYTLDLSGTKTKRIGKTIIPEEAATKSVVWSSSNPAVATVNAGNGFVSAVSVGTTVITCASAEDATVNATCTITVVNGGGSSTTGTITISPSPISIEVGETSQLTATVNGLTSQDVVWSSLNTAVVTVDQDGNVTGVSVGQAAVLATSAENNTIRGVCAVTVTEASGGQNVPVESVSLNKQSTSIAVGGTETLTATVLPSNATNKSVVWVSTNSSIVTVNNGVITGVSVGSAAITCRSASGEGNGAYCMVTVTEAVSLTLNPTSLTLEVGGSAQTISATVSPASANQAVTWASSNPAIAAVDGSGRVSPVAAGTATITCTSVADGSVTAICQVTVSGAVVGEVTSIALNKSTLELTVGASETLVATVLPSDATNKNVRWESSSNAVVAVNKGTVYAVSVGTATIICRSEENSDILARCEVTVIAGGSVDPEAPVIVPSEQTMELGTHYENWITSPDEGGTYDVDLWRYNEQFITMADPFVFQVTETDSIYYGKYVLYGTTGSSLFTCYISDDLVNWEFGSMVFQPRSISWGTDYLWAPEVAYDADEDLYYLFYSARNKTAQAQGLNTQQGWWVNLNVAVSESPLGPFVEYQEYALGANATSEQITNALKNPHYSWEQFLNNDDEKSLCGDFWTAIDPSPFVDPVSGKKYLLFTRDRCGSSNHTWVHIVEMEDWVTPKYETLTKLTSEDNGGYEKSGNSINEGPQMIYNAENQTYYLTFSVNDYDNSTYCVGQAIGSSPMGPFTKLHQNDGGLLMSGNYSNGEVSGTGHHSFITVGDQIYAAYHRHTNKKNGTREFAIDPVYYIDNGKGQTILHMSGPTTTLMPAIVSDYKNIAGDASVTVSGGTNVSALNDGIFAPHVSTTSLWSWVKEFQTVQKAKTTTEITFTFAQWRTIAGISILNSRDSSNTFSEIKQIKIEARSHAQDTTIYINNLAVNQDFITDEFGNAEVRLGSGAYASFEDLIVKSITITVYDEWGDGICIPEIQILGKEAAADPDFIDETNPTGQIKVYEYTSSEASSDELQDAIVIDGVADEAIYNDGRGWMEYKLDPSDPNLSEEASMLANSMPDATVRATVVYGAQGFYTLFDVSNSYVFVDTTHVAGYDFNNSGVQPYFQFTNASNYKSGVYEMMLCPDGYVGVVMQQSGGGSYNMPLEGSISKATVKGGEINTTAANGYVIESYFPWSMFGLSEAPASVQMDVALIAATSSTASGRLGWYSFGEYENEGVYQWANADSFWSWGTEGFGGGKINTEVASYDTNMGSVSVNPEYNFGDDIVVNVSANSGYRLNALYVDGVDVTGKIVSNKYTASAYRYNQTMHVRAEFAEISDQMQKVSGRLTATSGNSEVWGLPEGIQAKFSGSAGTYYAPITGSGQYEILLPSGTYTLTVEGYNGSKSVTVASSELTGVNHQFTKILSTDSAVSTSTIEPLTQYSSVLLDGITDTNFVLEYTVKANSSATSVDDVLDGMGFEIQGVGLLDHCFQTGYPENKPTYFRAMWNDTWDGREVESWIDLETFKSTGFTVRMVVEGNKYTPYYKNASGAWEQLGSTKTVSGTVTGHAIFTWNTNCYISSYAYYGGGYEVAVTTSVNDSAGGTLEVAPLKYGGTLTITATPASEYFLESLTLNGVNVADQVVDNVYTQANFGEFSATVVAKFTLDESTFKITGYANAAGGNSEAWGAMPAGTGLTFTRSSDGQTRYATTDSTGKWSADLPNGTWTLTADGYTGSKQYVVNGANADYAKSEAYVFSHTTFSMTETTLAGMNEQAYMEVTDGVNLLGSEFTLIYTIKAKSDVTTVANLGTAADPEVGFGLRMVGVNAGGNDFIAQTVYLSTRLVQQITDEWSNTDNIAVGEADTLSYLKGSGHKVMIVASAGTVKIYIEQDGKFVQSGSTLSGTVTDLTLNFWSSKLYIASYEYTPSVRNVKVETTFDSTKGTVTASDFVFGGSTTINATPNSGYELTKLEVNGVTVDAVNGQYTISDYTDGFLVTVKATFAEAITETYAVSGVLSAQGGVSGKWFVTQGTTVRFENTERAYTATVGMNGSYSVNLPNGTWTMSVDGYTGTKSITVNGAALTGQNLDTLKWNFYSASTIEPSAMEEFEVNVHADKDFTLTYTLKAKSTATTLADMGSAGLVMYYSGGNVAAQAGYIDGKMQARMFVGSWSGVDLASYTLDTMKDSGLKIMVIKQGDTFSMFYQSGTSWVSADADTWTEANVTSYKMYFWSGGIYVSEYTYEVGIPSVTVGSLTNDGNGTVSVSPTAISLGSAVTVTVTPNAQYSLKTLNVSGVEVDVNNEVVDNQYVISAYYGSLDFTAHATFQYVEAGKQLVSGTVKAQSGSAVWDLPEGTTLTFTPSSGTAVTTQVGANGAYSVALPESTTYTMTADKLTGSSSISVGTTAVTHCDYQFSYVFFEQASDCTSMTVTDTSITPSENNTYANSKYNSTGAMRLTDAFTIELTVKSNSTLATLGDYADGIGLKIWGTFTSDNTDTGRNNSVSNSESVCAQMTFSGNKPLATWCDEWSTAGWWQPDSTVAKHTSEGHRIAVTYDGTSMKLYLHNGTGWTRDLGNADGQVGTNALVGTVNDIQIFCWNSVNYISSYAYYPMVTING